jgi:hypothetical protein
MRLGSDSRALFSDGSAAVSTRPLGRKGGLRRLANNDICSRFGCMGVMSQQQERRVSRAIPLAALLAQTSSKQMMTSLFNISK